MYAPSLDRTDSANHVHPPILDLSKPDAELRGTVRAALMNTLTPMVGLVNHGCESACSALAEAMRLNTTLREFDISGILPGQSL
jgi:hypothetical protein